jgi:hypothetical protein
VCCTLLSRVDDRVCDTVSPYRHLVLVGCIGCIGCIGCNEHDHVERHDKTNCASKYATGLNPAPPYDRSLLNTPSFDLKQVMPLAWAISSASWSNPEVDTK